MRTSINIKNDKNTLLRYFRDRASEEYGVLTEKFADNQFKEKANEMNKFMIKSRDTIVSSILDVADHEHWKKQDLLESIMMVTYTNDVVMLETRNSIWSYDYMAFSRRIGELWEPFCKLCFNYSLRNIRPFVPPLFSDVKENLTDEIRDYIARLNITDEEKQQLNTYYDKVWRLVTSGEIKLECDLHFIDNGIKYVVDFKSGFGSNEKGNTNRLLLVGAIYQSISNDYRCMILVRSEENNHYLTTLQNSGVWDTSCGTDTYTRIQQHTGYNLSNWIHNNIAWMEDFSPEMKQHIEQNQLEQYLIW